MDEVWGADGRRIEVLRYAGRGAVYSDEPIPELIEREVLSGWGWRVSERSKDRDGSHRGGPNLPDSGPPRFTSREAALEAAIEFRAENRDFAGVPVVDWETGQSLEVDEAE